MVAQVLLVSWQVQTRTGTRVLQAVAFEIFSRVQLIIERNAAAGAFTERKRSGGMIVGAEANPPLRMELVSNLNDVKAGDDVIASGVDGIYPKGYRIGQVEYAVRGGGLYWSINVRPSVDFSGLEEVL